VAAAAAAAAAIRLLAAAAAARSVLPHALVRVGSTLKHLLCRLPAQCSRYIIPTRPDARRSQLRLTQ